jgi:erythromycin esterase-like protein
MSRFVSRRLITALGCLAASLTLSAQAQAATSALTAAPAAADCQPQTQVDVKTIQSQIVLVGELHGTQEIPAFVSGLVCSLLRDGRSVILAVERNGEEQEGLNRFLQSDGAEPDRQALLQGERWASPNQDGRASQAMLALLDDMRRLRRAGQRVGVLAMQGNENLWPPMDAADKAPLDVADGVRYSQLNDSAMANSVLANAVLYRRYTVLVLAGSTHTTTARGLPWDQDHEAMGYLVSTRQPCFRIGFSSSNGGTAWATKANGYREQAVAPGELYISGTPLDAVVRLSRLTGSPSAGTPRPN